MHEHVVFEFIVTRVPRQVVHEAALGQSLHSFTPHAMHDFVGTSPKNESGQGVTQVLVFKFKKYAGLPVESHS